MNSKVMEHERIVLVFHVLISYFCSIEIQNSSDACKVNVYENWILFVESMRENDCQEGFIELSHFLRGQRDDDITEFGLHKV